MFGSLPQPAFMPCQHCGASVARSQQSDHVCDEAQRISYEHRQVRLATDRFDTELTRWLTSPAGRFEVFYAERERRHAA
jgi:hypothetical protein